MNLSGIKEAVPTNSCCQPIPVSHPLCLRAVNRKWMNVIETGSLKWVINGLDGLFMMAGEALGTAYWCIPYHDETDCLLILIPQITPPRKRKVICAAKLIMKSEKLLGWKKNRWNGAGVLLLLLLLRHVLHNHQVFSFPWFTFINPDEAWFCYLILFSYIK